MIVICDISDDVVYQPEIPLVSSRRNTHKDDRLNIQFKSNATNFQVFCKQFDYLHWI